MKFLRLLYRKLGMQVRKYPDSRDHCQSVLYAFDDEQQRARWSNFPTGFVPPGGVSLRDMTPKQRAAAMVCCHPRSARRDLRKFSRSWKGMRSTRSRRRRTETGRRVGTAAHCRAEAVLHPQVGALHSVAPVAAHFSVRVSTTSPSCELPLRGLPGCCSLGDITWRSTLTIDGDRGVLTPILTGAQPALYLQGGKPVRPRPAE
jgi:hypothetical protein